MKLPPPPPTPPQPVAVLEDAAGQHYLRLGMQFMSQVEAAAIWNTAAKLGGPNASCIVAAMAAGVVIAAVDQVVTAVCGKPPDGVEDKFGALPELAQELFRRLGVIRQPAPAVDQEAPPRPVESQAELVQRAAKAGIVLA